MEPYQRLRAIRNLDLPRGPKTLLKELAVYADSDGSCFPSHSTLAENMSCCEKSVRNWQAVLIDRGYLKVDSGGGRHRSNTYQLILENPVTVTDFQNENSVTDSRNPVTGSSKPGKGYRRKEPVKEPVKEGVRTRFQKPSVADVKTYAAELGESQFDAEAFIDYYTTNGWKVGRTAMRNWHAAVRTWIRRNKNSDTHAADPAAAAAWEVLCRAVTTHSAHQPEKVKAAVCARTWDCCQRAGGLSAIDGATAFNLNRIREKFINAWRDR